VRMYVNGDRWGRLIDKPYNYMQLPELLVMSLYREFLLSKRLSFFNFHSYRKE